MDIEILLDKIDDIYNRKSEIVTLLIPNILIKSPDVSNVGEYASKIKQLDDDLYYGKITGKNLWAVMERVNENNYRMWENYGTVQSGSRAADFARNFMPTYTNDGSGHFHEVLKTISYKTNEMWIAYITRAFPQKIPNIISYNGQHLMKSDYKFVKDIEMFVTITSSPNALITSHMGISVSIEAVVGENRTTGLSIDLHSFAAKVMLLRNPNRKYMVTAPVFAMENIIMKTFSKGVYIGTQEMKKLMEERQRVTLDEFIAKNENKTKEFNEKIRKAAQRKIKSLNEALTEGENIEDLEVGLYVELKDGKFIASDDKIIKGINNKMYEEFIMYKNPYSFGQKHWKIKEKKHTDDFLKAMEKYPPILSVDDIKSITNKFIIYNPETQTPWLSVNNTNPNYKWMFERVFKPQGVTHYIVVDLVELANSKPIEE